MSAPSPFVVVLSSDPTSPLSPGALLRDREGTIRVLAGVHDERTLSVWSLSGITPIPLYEFGGRVRITLP